MEIREFAERVLFEPGLAEKLADPGKLTDAHPGKVAAVPPGPARETGCAMERSGPRHDTRFPRPAEFDDDQRRGEALHFFANHELLALEIMALTLLRFPDAPKSWRRTVAATMRDEQRHTRLYLGRMADLGVGFGEVPLSDFFWRVGCDIKDPMSYNVVIAMTLEQANLDFSNHYRKLFRQMGDIETATILDEVYEDEIDHVRRGVLFVDRWKDDGVSMWDAYVKALPETLTPARAKGIGFVEDARLKAGLSPAYIERLRVYSHSKGAPPNVYWFNPDCEIQVVTGHAGRTSRKNVVALTRDLEAIQTPLAHPSDVVLVREAPRLAWLAELQKAGFSLPQYVDVELDKGRLPEGHALLERRIGDLCPWGWSPDAWALLGPLASRLTGDVSRQQIATPEKAITSLYSKAFAAQQLRTLWEAHSDAGDWLCEAVDIGVVCQGEDQVLSAAETLWQAGVEVVAFKAPYGNNGRGTQRLTMSERHAEDDVWRRFSGWLHHTLKDQNEVVVEPWRKRVLDLSMSFVMDDDGTCRILGWRRFLTDDRGRFRGAVMGRSGTGLSADRHRFLHGEKRSTHRVAQMLSAAVHQLAPSMAQAGFRGRAGIDAMVYLDADAPEGLRFKPLLEVNARTTMGHVAFGLDRRVAGQSAGLWLFVDPRALKASKATDFSDLLSQLQQRLPLKFKGPSEKQIETGVVATNDPERTEICQSLLVVARDLGTLRQTLVEVGLRDPLE